MELFIGLGVVWVIGFSGYIITNRKDKYNNLKYYNVTDKIKKYKKVSKRVNDSGSNLFS